MACKGEGDSHQTSQNLEPESAASKSSSSDKAVVQKDGQYSDPVYKNLSRINGEVNKLSKTNLQLKLKQFGLDTRGVKEVLRKRLKNYHRRKKLSKAHLLPPDVKKYDYLAVIDFEATCEDDVHDYQHEIIEFPVVLIDLDQLKVVDKFQEYVRPVVNPRLTSFCTKLTGITQAQVDKADKFPAVLERVQTWFDKHELGSRHSFAVLTDGPWDMYRFMYLQCELCDLSMPKWSRRWVNVRKAFSNFYQCPKAGIESMLKNLGMKFEGSPHCGLDDATNIARIAISLLEDGCPLRINEYIDIQCDPTTNKTSVRFEAFREKERESEADSKSASSVNRSSRSSKKSRSVTEVDQLRMDQISLQSTLEQQEEDIDDLIRFYKSQK